MKRHFFSSRGTIEALIQNECFFILNLLNFFLSYIVPEFLANSGFLTSLEKFRKFFLPSVLHANTTKSGSGSCATVTNYRSMWHVWNDISRISFENARDNGLEWLTPILQNSMQQWRMDGKKERGKPSIEVLYNNNEYSPHTHAAVSFFVEFYL